GHAGGVLQSAAGYADGNADRDTHEHTHQHAYQHTNSSGHHDCCADEYTNGDTDDARSIADGSAD
ncbi:MAG TPA: hypothetical protein PKC18_20610, partial [Lacipirellulaceae bacterium]|nr:hypothetical protein [Lacipirellulaceae bacterium]